MKTLHTKHVSHNTQLPISTFGASSQKSQSSLFFLEICRKIFTESLQVSQIETYEQHHIAELDLWSSNPEDFTNFIKDSLFQKNIQHCRGRSVFQIKQVSSTSHVPNVEITFCTPQLEFGASSLKISISFDVSPQIYVAKYTDSLPNRNIRETRSKTLPSSTFGASN